MRLRHTVFLTALLAAGCGTISDSRLNPVNWFGSGRSESVAATAQPSTPRDGRALIRQVVSLQIDRTPGGAIVKAIGLPETQAHYDAELVPLGDGAAVDGVLEYQFRISPPAGTPPAGPPQSREVVVALFVTNQTLVGVRTIRVSGADNAVVVRR